ncbi:F-box/LRR-repeat protein [Trifolium medium]|uniref:F-box/LRR-repeat protein n=1 Tax=Trifolium medium TaxID=97028 RepID=A0A392M8V5_9FABA|nr:F-box/LRR-repeat protein [Trifolium medium]
MATAAKDRISSLSDDILLRILSLNSTKDAVRTRVLSKRWINLWHSIPLLDFTDTKLLDVESIVRFIQFVYSYLLSRDTAGSHSIDSFSLDIQYANPNHVQPLIIPSFTTWVNLVLQRQVKYLNLNLSLHNAVLEDLKVCNVFIPEEVEEEEACQNLNLSKLIRADVTDCWCLFPIKAFVNSEFLRIQIRLEYTTTSPYTDDQLPIFYNLTHLVINNTSFEVLQVLHRCPKLQNLVIYQKTQTEWEWEWDEERWGKEDFGAVGQESWVVPKSAPPQCFSFSLRTCTIQDFALLDLQHDIMLASYILSNAGVLETMTIWRSDTEQLEIERELSSCPRASATCQLLVY